jgi:lysophospholipase L1-like esterase
MPAKIKILLVVCLYTAVFQPIVAQTIDQSAYSKLKYIQQKINIIENDSVALQSFYEKLYRLDKHEQQRVSIVHMGDSHLQADVFSGAVRQNMQRRFGNAGRGLIFPYRVAKSNEPNSYKTTTNILWDSKRNSILTKSLPIGISGFTIETADTSAMINLMVKDQPGLGYAFTKFTLFHEKGKNNYDLTVCDEYNCEMAIFNSSNCGADPFASKITFESPVRQIILRSTTKDSTEKRSTRIYGILLENDSSGILYNMVGANGAEVRHYNMSKYFMDQLPSLNPDLVIISLGTNDAYPLRFNPTAFRNQMDTLITNIKRLNPNANVLLTTPPDSYRKTRRGRVKNLNMKSARLVIVNYCKQHNLPYWDLYEVMGGYGSMAKWYASGLAAKDRIHFTGKGYLIQGDLFYRALMKGYANYVKLYYP